MNQSGNETDSRLPKTLDFTSRYYDESEDEIAEEDGLQTLSTWCAECGGYNIGECFIHGDVTVAHDNELPSRAVLSLPKILSLKQLKTECFGNGSKGVVAKKALKPRTQFGPMEGERVTSKPMQTDGSMEFLLIDSNGRSTFLLLTDESKCNWMMFVRPAHDFTSQNLAAFQKDDAIYFVTIKEIPVGTELCVWYAAPYAKSLGKDILLPSKCAKNQPSKAAAKKNVISKSPKEKIPKQDSSSKKQREKVARDRVPRSTKMRESVTKNSSHLFECSTCGAQFARISQKVNHVCKEMDEQEGNITELGTRRRKGRPRKLVNNAIEKNIPKFIVESNGYSNVDSQGDILLSTKRVKNGNSSSKDGNLPDFSAYDFMSSQDPSEIDAEKDSKASLDKNQGSEASVTAIKEDVDLMYSCDQCSYTSVSPDILKAHKLTHTKADEYTCGVEGCKKIFNSKFKFMRHLNVHIRPNQYRCKICNSTFNRSDHLKNHMPIHACNRTMFTCDICGKSYLYKSTLVFHKAKHEANEGSSLTCLVCEETFSCKGDLKVHLTSHNRYKPDIMKPKTHQCPQCDKKFVTNKDVKRHLITHSKDRPFLCEHCPQTFVRKDHLRRHYISHHKKEIYESQLKTSSHGCRVCLKVFKKKDHLDYHMQDLHPNGIEEPEPPPRKMKVMKEKKIDLIQNTQKPQIATLQDNLFFQSYKQDPAQFVTLPTKSQLQQAQIMQQSHPAMQQQQQKQSQMQTVLHTQSPGQSKKLQQMDSTDVDRLDFVHLGQALGLQPVQTSKTVPSGQLMFSTGPRNTTVNLGNPKSVIDSSTVITTDSVKIPDQILKFVTKQEQQTQIQNIQLQPLLQQNIQQALLQQRNTQQEQQESIQQNKVVQNQQQLFLHLQQQQEQQHEQQQQQFQLLQTPSSEDKSNNVPPTTPTPSEFLFPNNIINLMSSLEPTKNIEWSLAGDPSTSLRNNKMNMTSNSEAIPETLQPSLATVTANLEKPSQSYLPISSAQFVTPSTAPPNKVTLANIIDNSNIGTAKPLASTSSLGKSVTEEDLLRFLSLLKPTKILNSGTSAIVNEPDANPQPQLQIKQDPVQSLPAQQLQLQQPQQQPQDDFGNQQQQVVANFPVSWTDGAMTDFSGLGDLSMSSDGSLIMTGGVTPLPNLIIQLPVNVQEFPQLVTQPQPQQQQQQFIQQAAQPPPQPHQAQLIQEQQQQPAQIQLLQQTQLLQQQAQAQLFQHQQQQQILQPQAQSHLLHQQPATITVPLTNAQN